MTRTTSFFASLALLLAASSAEAGWYEIKNYVGTVGKAPVHVSLQTFDAINHGEPGQWRVVGSYYYDAHRVPIPLHGQRRPDGHMALCEAPPPSGNEVPFAALAACPIRLAVSDDGASGEWNDGKSALPISLRQVGSLDDTERSGSELTGTVEIPMWYHTKTHLLLGIYASAGDCPVSMLRLRLVNIATGRTDGDIPFECEAGMIMTDIYANVSQGRGTKAGQVTVGFQGGKMGYDVDVTIEPHAPKSVVTRQREGE